MKRILLSVAFMTCSILGAQAQTKLIFHKSHSGDLKIFEEALLHDESFENSNFGAAPRRRVVNARLDSLIYISDTSVIMVTSMYCTDPKGSYSDYEKGSHLWKPGRRLISVGPTSSHGLVYKDVDTAEIRKDIDRFFHFRNKASTVVIIDAKDSLAKAEQEKPTKKKRRKRKKKKQAYLPVAEEGSNMPPSMLSMILVLGVISLAIALIYQWLQPKSDKVYK